MEGPSVKALALKLSNFKNCKVIDIESKLELKNNGFKVIDDIFSVGKNLFFKSGSFYIKVHFGMYGSYRINSSRNIKPRLKVITEKGFVEFYKCSVKLISEKDYLLNFDEELDIISDKWSFEKVLEKAKNYENEFICDLLLYQDLFAGVGNIIKNEALYASKVHPLSIKGKISYEKFFEIAKNAREFSYKFLERRINNEPIKPILKIYRKKNCEVCGNKIKLKKLGKLNRINFFCDNCQILYA